MSSSDVGDGARDGIAEGGETGGAVAADCFAREATGFDLRFFAMSYCSTVGRRRNDVCSIVTIQ